MYAICFAQAVCLCHEAQVKALRAPLTLGYYMIGIEHNDSRSSVLCYHISNQLAVAPFFLEDSLHSFIFKKNGFFFPPWQSRGSPPPSLPLKQGRLGTWVRSDIWSLLLYCAMRLPVTVEQNSSILMKVTKSDHPFFWRSKNIEVLNLKVLNSDNRQV